MIRGFTLTETLVSIALMTMLVIGSHAAAAAVHTAMNRVRASAALLREAQFVRERVIDDLYPSTGISIATEDVLILDRHMGAPVTFAKEGASLIYRDGDAEVAVVSGGVHVDSFSASYRSRDDGLVITLQLSARDDSGTTTEVFIYTLYP